MLTLEDIKKNAAIAGIDPAAPVRIVATEPVGENALTVIYKTVSGAILERMLFRGDEESLSHAVSARPWAFDTSGEEFKLATEALRIHLAHLFDPMMAVHTSNVEPLPHQITAVYESMLPKQPLRFVLADDPGAGKTIMAGLYIRELLMRADVARVLIVAPGSLVNQWQDELIEKFGLSFTLFSREHIEQSISANPFEVADFLIARVDQLSRSEELQQSLRLSQWDLIVVDEAHKLSANYYGNKVNKTRRFELGELLGSITRHFLLMTATPHNGKEADFQLFLSLLDSDRFYGKFRDGVHKIDPSDIMRRMVKEDMLRFDGTRLFPLRRAYTASYKLSSAEAALYESVTSYVRGEMNRADGLSDNTRKSSVGFALASLQRRLASSPEAIYQSLRRRHAKMKHRLEEERSRARGSAMLQQEYATKVPDDLWDAEDQLQSEEFEVLEEELVDAATAAQTIQELEAELVILAGLEYQALQLRNSNQDRKWDELSQLLQGPDMRNADGHQRKLIIFTEHKDTLHYLQRQICNLLGSDEAVVIIHGGVHRDDRRKVQELFRNDSRVRIMLATDAAGEGVNLQNANLMVNYDLPWNPNRLEQRFGRIHRIGQTQVCHLWNMLAQGTREGDVFQRLFEKLEVEREALGGRVFDILGEVFEEKSLKDLLIEAIRFGEDPQRRAELLSKVEGALDVDRLNEILRRNALSNVGMDIQSLFSVKEEMEKAEARKLQPYFIRSYFQKAFQHFGGELQPREQGRFEIRHVPALIRERGRQLAGRDRRNLNPVITRYERVCFEKKFITVPDRPTSLRAELLHPAHPLMQAITDLLIEESRVRLKQGAVFIDPVDTGMEPHVLFLIDHAVRQGGDSGRTISRRIQFVQIAADGAATNAGWAPHLDLQPATAEDAALIPDILNASWITGDLEQLAIRETSQYLAPEHLESVRTRVQGQADRTLAAVRERLVKEINHQQNRRLRIQDEIAAGRIPRVNLDNVDHTLGELTARLETRQKELLASREVSSATPVVLGGALVIPAGLLAQRRGETSAQGGWSADAAARQRIERIAMQSVMDAERAIGNQVYDVSAEKCGWDVTSQPPGTADCPLPPPRHIEVKGRALGATTITVTKGEILYGLNQKDKFLLAVVLVDGDTAQQPRYIRHPFTQEPDWATTSINLDLSSLLSRAESSPMETDAF
jgi:superfamily II DNA or RNA helicase